MFGRRGRVRAKGGRMKRWPVWLLSILTVLAAAGCGGGGKAGSQVSSKGSRPATPAEARDLAAALRAFNGGAPETITSAKSLSNPTYASVIGSTDGTIFLFHRRGSSWARSYARNAAALVEDFRPGQSVAACSYAPARVVRDLYGVICPPDRALHARRASATERAVFNRLHFTATGLTAEQTRLYDECVSRLDPRWAGALLVDGPPDSHSELEASFGGDWWFERRNGAWHLARSVHRAPSNSPSLLSRDERFRVRQLSRRTEPQAHRGAPID